MWAEGIRIPHPPRSPKCVMRTPLAGQWLRSNKLSLPWRNLTIAIKSMFISFLESRETRQKEFTVADLVQRCLFANNSASELIKLCHLGVFLLLFKKFAIASTYLSICLVSIHSHFIFFSVRSAKILRFYKNILFKWKLLILWRTKVIQE